MPKLALLLRSHIGSQPQGEVVCGWRTASAGDTHRPFGESMGEEFPVALSDGFHNAIGRICIPFIPSKSLIHCYSSLFLLCSQIAHDSILWIRQERNEPLCSIPQNWGSQLLTYMLFLCPQEKSRVKKIFLSPKLCQPGGRMSGENQAVPFNYSNIFRLIFLFFLVQSYAKNSPLYTWTSTKAVSSMSDSLKTVHSRDSQTTIKIRWSQVNSHCRIHSQNHDLPTYYLTNGTRSHSSFNGTVLHGKMSFLLFLFLLLLKGRNKTEVHG